MTKKKREDIQGLRAVAIIMVLLFHFYPSYFPNGYVGVDMFFVISGFIIAMVFPKEWNRANIVDFYYRRVKRIFPLYFSVIFVFLVAITLLAPDNFVQVNLNSGKRAVLFTSNIMSAHSAELGYERLIAKADDLFTHCWSLCLEIQWYLLAPALFFFTTFRLTACQAVFVLSGFYYCTANESVAFNSVFARLWQFIAGIVAHDLIKFAAVENLDDDGIPLVSSKVPSTDFLMLTTLSNIYAAALLLGFLPSVLHPTVLRAVLTVATAALLLSGSVVKVPLLSTPLFSWIGNISYSLYLGHWPIYITAKNLDFPLSLEIGLCLSVVLAALLYQYFEMNYLSWEKLTIFLFVISMFAASLFMTISGMGIRRMFYHQLSPEEIMTQQNSKMPWLALNIAEGGLHNNTNNLGGPLCKYDSMFGIPTNAPLGHCEMPNGNGTLKVLVLGNSWASNQGPTVIYDTFKHLAKEFNVYSLTGCEPLQTSPFCKQWPNYGKQAVEFFKPDVLFLIHRVISAIPRITSEKLDQDSIFIEFLDHLRFYETIAKKIYIQQGVPWCTGPCTTQAVNKMRAEGKNLSEIGDQFIQRDQRFSRIRIAELGKRCKNCEIIDFLPYYDLATNGLPVPYNLERNLVLLDDQIHLNKFGKERVRPLFEELARNLTIV